MTDFVKGFGEIEIDNIDLTSTFKFVEDRVTGIQHLRSCRPPPKKTVLKLINLLMNVCNKMVINTTFDDFRY